MAGSAAEEWKAWLKSEYEDEAKYTANMALLRAVALFAGAVVIMRNWDKL